jgi:DNA topoisomerase 2-associated protein PAT1
MKKHEKELIAKIQISQLVTDDPFVDDFYFQMKALAKKKLVDNPEKKPKKKGKKSGKWQDSVGQLIDGTKGSGAVISNQMQQQMKRLIESRRALKPRESTCNSYSNFSGCFGGCIRKNIC